LVGYFFLFCDFLLSRYSKLIVTEMGRIEMILKVVMTPVEEVSTFVEHACKLVPDSDLAEFTKVLDMKGLKRPEQGPFLEEFKMKSGGSLKGALTPSDGISSGGTGESSRIKKLEKLIKKRLWFVSADGWLVGN